MKKQFLSALSLFATMVAGAQTPGQPDLNFDGDGYVKIDFHNKADFGYAVLPYGNDILTCGISDSVDTRKPAFTRLRADGSYNNLLAGDGNVRVSPSGLEASAYGMAVQPDNKIVVVGDFSNSEYGMVFRMSGTGGVDAGFGNGGYISHLRNGKDREFYYDAYIQTDGKMLVTGYTCLVNDCNMVLMRLKTNGQPDSTFGTNGFVYSTTSGNFEGGDHVTVDANGKIVVACYNNGDMVVLRFNSNGTPDNTFSLDGRVSYNAGFSEDVSAGLFIQPDGKIIVAGQSYNRPNPSAIVVRFNEDGTFDNTFGVNGVVDTSFTGDIEIYAAAFQPDGKILLGGGDRTGTERHVLLARLNSNGTVDNTFGTNGYYITSFSPDGETLTDLCMLPDGRIAGTGHIQYGSNYDMLTAVFASGINVGVLKFDTKQSTALVFPNPVQSTLNIEFELMQEENLNISLVDLSGRVMQQFSTNEKHVAGKHTRSFEVGQVAKGQYLLTLQSAQGTRAIHVTLN